MDEHGRIPFIEINFQIVLLLPLEKIDDACSHLPDFFVYPYEVGVGEVRSFTILHFHVCDPSQHCRYQQVVALVNFSEIDENQEYYVLEYPIFLTEISLLEYYKNLLN